MMMKKRIMSKGFVLSFVLLISMLFSACSSPTSTEIEKDPQKYEEAVAKLRETGLDVYGRYTVTEDLIVASENAEYVTPKNIIYMIGDGMGDNIIEATERYHADDLYEGKLAMNHMPLLCHPTTYSADYQVTDSAAGGTALATGFKTNNGVVAKDSNLTKDYKTLLELAAEKGKSTGIICTKWVTDATPAAFTAHVNNRTEEEAIADQQLEKIADGTLDVVLGGGQSKYKRDDNKSLFFKALESGMTYVTKWEEAQGVKAPLVGLFSHRMMDTTDPSMPTLAQMTDLALETLSEDENGFFLMVEGAQIDTHAHSNDLTKEAIELYYFDQAVAVAMRYVAMNPDTVLIVTADHECGGLELPEQKAWAGALEGEYTSESHTWVNVNLYALGYKTEELSQIKENVDVAIFIANLLGEENFGQKSNLQTVYNAEEKEHRKVLLENNENTEKVKKTVNLLFDKDNNVIKIPVKQLEFKTEALKDVRAVHITITNCNEEKIDAPSLKLMLGKEMIASITNDYLSLEPGETRELTYVLSENEWKNVQWEKLTDIVIYFEENSTVNNLELHKVQITERTPNK